MGERTQIAWCDHTFNPWRGCEKVSPGCANCYAERHGQRGGESGPQRRPCELKWVADLVTQCRRWEIPVFVKQLDLGGQVVADVDRFPVDLRVQEFPQCS